MSVVPVKHRNGQMKTAVAPSKHATPRACDACFAQKERCIRPGAGQDCQRCARLSKTCVSNRPVKPPGRKRLLPPPRAQNPLLAANRRAEKELKLPYSLHPFGVLFKDLKPLEEFMVREFVNPSNFTQLMVMPRIGKAMHEEAVQVFLRHYDDLHDGCFSMYGAFASAMSMEFPGYDNKASLQRATAALKRFSALPCPETTDDFARWIWLGLTVAIYAHCELGSPATPVRKTILAHLVALGEKRREMRKHPLVVSFTTLEILECLIYRQRPVLDLEEECILGLESFPGLATPLIRFLYRLCVINCMEADGQDEDGGAFALDELEKEVEAWQPDVDPKDLAKCTAIEASHVLTRTRVHKTAILLYIHRIRHPFGEEDSKADALAASILSDLDLATATTKQPPEWVTFPFLLAGIEATGMEKTEKVERDLNRYVDSISPKARAMTLEFLRAVWGLRDEMGGFGFRWMDVVDVLPPLCVYI